MREHLLSDLVVGIKGAGEMASGVAWRLWQANIRRIFMLEIPSPMAVRRQVSFCEAIYEKKVSVDGVSAVRVESLAEISRAWEQGQLAVAADPRWTMITQMHPQIVIDAILAKMNLGTRLDEASLVIGLGPGFQAGVDVHMVIETNRGHNLGRVLLDDAAEPNTGIPGDIGGYAQERVLRAPCNGVFTTEKQIGVVVRQDELIGTIAGQSVAAGIAGVIRGLLRGGTEVVEGTKLGDIDPRGETGYCATVSDKALALGGAALEAILRVYNG